MKRFVCIFRCDSKYKQSFYLHKINTQNYHYQLHFTFTFFYCVCDSSLAQLLYIGEYFLAFIQYFSSQWSRYNLFLSIWLSYEEKNKRKLQQMHLQMNINLHSAFIHSTRKLNAGIANQMSYKMRLISWMPMSYYV